MPDNRIADLKQTVTDLRKLAPTEPGKYDEQLASALAHLGDLLANAGRSDEAEEALTDAVEIMRALDNKNPGTHDDQLARTLGSLGAVLARTEHTHESLEATEQAVGIFRRLDAANPDDYDMYLGQALHNLGLNNARVGKVFEANAVLLEAVDLLRTGHGPTKATEEVSLARALSSLSRTQEAIGEQKAARVTVAEAIELYRKHLDAAPGLVPEFSETLSRQATFAWDADEFEQFLAINRELVNRYQGLAEGRPELYMRQLAQALSDVGAGYAALERTSEAEAAESDAVDLLRDLARKDFEHFAPALASMLTTWALHHYQLDALDDAIDNLSEAVDLLTALDENYPDNYAETLAQTRKQLDILNEKKTH